MTKLNEVLEYAKMKHGSQRRRGGELYYNHVVEVGEVAKAIALKMVGEYTFLQADIEFIEYAGILHDTIEDTNTNYDIIAELVNTKVADWVSFLSNDKRLPREYRRALYDKIIRSACIQVKIIKLADVYSNLVGIRGTEGDIWISGFKEKSRKVLEFLSDELSKTTVFLECIKMVNR
jgi:(p)ppGpp synthase/HD superfamily hydrolase